MNDPLKNTPKGARIAMGIFMIIVYIGVGLLFIFDVFNFFNNHALACILGGFLCAYGLFRAYRLYRMGR